MYALRCSFGIIILVFCFSTKVHAKLCLESPILNLPRGCSVRNLSIVNNFRNAFVNPFSCNGTVQRIDLTPPFQIQFQNTPHNKTVKYLLTAVDVTAKQLLWMVSNITVHDINLLHSSPGLKSIFVKNYTDPIYNVKYPKHEIEFLIFEENFNATETTRSQLSIGTEQPFNLTLWIERQYTFKNKLCGPISGGNVVMSDNVSPNTVPGPNPTSNSRNTSSTSSKSVTKNNGFSFKFGNSLITQIVVLYAFVKHLT